jgi:hypothetical protein
MLLSSSSIQILIAKAPADIQAAVKKADLSLSKHLGSDLHKASNQIAKAPKQ